MGKDTHIKKAYHQKIEENVNEALSGLAW